MKEKRIIDESYYIIEHKSTVRKTAEIFGVSKSTVHKDVSVLLKKIDYALYKKVKEILDENFNEKHLRGGNATKLKYQKLHENAKKAK